MYDFRTQLLLSYLDTSGIDFGFYEGSGVNDIMKTNLDKGVYSILIEFNEKLEDKRLNELLEVIGRWIKEWSPEKLK